MVDRKTWTASSEDLSTSLLFARRHLSTSLLLTRIRHFIIFPNKKVGRQQSCSKEEVATEFLESLSSTCSPFLNQYRKMIARIPLLFCLLAGSSAAFPVAPQSKTSMPKKTVLAMSNGGSAPVPPAVVDLKVSSHGLVACGLLFRKCVDSFSDMLHSTNLFLNTCSLQQPFMLVLSPLELPRLRPHGERFSSWELFLVATLDLEPTLLSP